MKSALLVLFALVAQATTAPEIRTSTLAFSWFLDPNGNTGFASAIRFTDPNTLITKTSVSYSFCVQTTAASCQSGNGDVPNSAFQGDVRATSAAKSTLIVNVDTNIAGYSNQICQFDQDGFPFNCSPATGGPINVTFVKTRSFAETITNEDLIKRHGKTSGTSADITHQFSGKMNGSVLGVPANTASISGIVSFETLQRTGEDVPTSSIPPGLAKYLATQGKAGRKVLKQLAR